MGERLSVGSIPVVELFLYWNSCAYGLAERKVSA
jgi:hypothetical protein